LQRKLKRGLAGAVRKKEHRKTEELKWWKEHKSPHSRQSNRGSDETATTEVQGERVDKIVCDLIILKKKEA